MKYGLIAIIVAILGIGEYAFVEFYPLPQHRRVQKLEKLPIVGWFVLQSDLELVRAAFDRSDSGEIRARFGRDSD